MTTLAIVNLILAGTLLLGFVLLKKRRNKKEIARVLSYKSVGDYLYEAVLKLRDGKVVRKLIFCPSRLKKGAAVLVEESDGSLWKVKPL